MNISRTFDKAIREEIDHGIRILSRLREVLEAEINSVLNGPSPGVPKGALTQMKEISSTLNSLADAKVRLEKSAKLMADAMSAEDEESAVRSWIRALDKKKRQTFLDSEIQCLSREQV